METWALRPASHLARSLLRHCIDEENLPPKILRTPEPLLVIRTPPVSAPATNRARTLRKGISSLETGIAAVGQAYDGRPVRSRRRLLGCFLGGVGLGLHLYSLPLGCGCLIDARLPATLVFCIIYYNYTTRRSTEQNRCLPSVLFLRALHHCVTDEQASARQRRTPARRHRA